MNGAPVAARVVEFTNAQGGTIGKRIKLARGHFDWTAADLAGHTQRFDAGGGISAATLRHIECDRRPPQPRAVRLLAQALGVPAQWLRDGRVAP